MVTQWPPNVWMGVRDPWGRPIPNVKLRETDTNVDHPSFNNNSVESELGKLDDLQDNDDQEAIEDILKP